MSDFGNAKTLPTLDPQAPKSKNPSGKRWARRIAYLFVGLLIGAALGLHFLPGPLLAQTMRGILSDGGLRMTTPSHSSLSLITSHAAMNDVAIYKDKHAEPLLSWETLDFDADALSFLFTDTYALDSFEMEGMRLNFRFPNGYQGNASWEEYFKSLNKEWDRNLSEQPSRTQKNNLTIQTCTIQGDAILWPEESVFDIQTFSLKAYDLRKSKRNVLPAPLSDKITYKPLTQHRLQSRTSITGAANEALSFEAQILDFEKAHSVSLIINNIPSDELQRYALSSGIDNLIKSFGPTGSCDLHFYQSIAGDTRKGTLLLCSDNLLFNPVTMDPEHIFSPNIRNLAQRIRQLRSLNKNEYIEWSMSWEQVGDKPVKIDYGMHKIFKHLSQRIQTLEAAKQP